MIFKQAAVFLRCSDKAAYAGQSFEELLPLFWIKVGLCIAKQEDSVTVLGVFGHSKDAAEEGMPLSV